MQAKIKPLLTSSILQNSINLILSTGILSLFGFLFWVLSTRLLPVDQIGIATTMISAMSVISIFSLLGFDSSIVRFLANTTKKDNKLNTSIIIVGTTALFISSIFIFFLDHFSPQLSILGKNIFTSLSFIFFCVATAINILTDSVFLSYRQTKYTLIINGVFSFVKMFLPLFFYKYGAFGIFFAAAMGQTIGFIVSILVMMWKFNYKPRFTIDTDIIKEVWRFCLGNYLSGVLNLLPIAVLPIIITNRIGPKESAYFYMIMMIINLLYTIPQAVTKSLFAEGSFDEISYKENIRRSLLIISSLVLPAILFLVLFGNKILLVFGKGYTEGNSFLTIMSISTLFICVNTLFNSYFRIKKNVNGLLLSSFANVIGIIGFTYLFLNMGLFGIGLSWILGLAFSSFISFATYRFYFTIPSRKILSHLPYWRGFDDRLIELNMVLNAKLHFIKSFILNGFKFKTVVFYPQKPKCFHSAYLILNNLGYRTSNNPNLNAVATFIFEDTTKRTPDPVIEELHKNRKLYNYGCDDISKEKVEEVFQKVFGYGTFVDPETHQGKCVRKSNTNAVHDGKIVMCPTKKEDGYIYQKFIDTLEGDKRTEARLIIMGKNIPFVVKRHKTIDDPFDSTYGGDILETSSILSAEEIDKVLEFCKEFGLDYGEIDSLRDNADGKLYLVDANNTPSGPPAGRAVTRSEFNILRKKQITAFTSAFLN